MRIKGRACDSDADFFKAFVHGAEAACDLRAVCVGKLRREEDEVFLLGDQVTGIGGAKHSLCRGLVRDVIGAEGAQADDGDLPGRHLAAGNPGGVDSSRGNG